ncbi:MAG: beta-glucosidase [Dactylosporangium sp.]|nr:glycoside hydrolase family 3 C-terminal domain-containing protein [Dactylosporangium sp.]NNJ62800.1 beta-glucosidase [Dactylosporangium sp.]
MVNVPTIRLSRRAAGRTLVRTALGVVAARVALDASPALAARPGGAKADIDALLEAMSLDEKVSMLHGAVDPASVGQAGYLPGVARLGIPELRLADGPAGVRVTAHATALPAPVALAATFSPELARRYGQVIGTEGRALGIDVLLAPMTNIVRVPQAGRNFETFGEDPALASAIVAAEVGGIQSAGLIATVKHYAVNNFENDRQSISVEIDERTLREIYLPAFEAAIEAGAGAVMAAYNQVNGVFCAEHTPLLTDVLRTAWGFEGFVMSDWYAAHSGPAAITAGLDLEMPGGLFFTSLVDAVRDGQLAESVIDAALRRILDQMRRFDLLADRRSRPKPETASHASVAREIAIAGAVLLRNERATLPLHDRDLRSLAVIGPSARTPLIGGGGSARVIPASADSPLEALRRAAGAEAGQIAYAPGVDLDGVPIPATALTLTRTGPDGTTYQDAQVDFTGEAALPAGTSWTWTGTLTAPQTGDYDLRIQGAGGVASFFGSITLTLDDTRIGSVGAMFGGNSRLIATADGLTNAGTVVPLVAGESRLLTIAAEADASAPLQVRLAWVTPRRVLEALDEAVALARTAEAVLVFAFNEGTEGQDRPSLSLPDGQDPVVEAVADANQRTAVVLNTGDPVLMPWLERTGAVLQLWYPGQEGADATVALLLGDADPAGKLPVTYPRELADAPTSPVERYPGVDGHAVHGEGIFVGYRHYDATGTIPLFPFGHGLSYTEYRYDALATRRHGDGVEVSFVVRNTGGRSGVEVAQVYLGPPDPAPVPMAQRQLVGFARVELRAGQRRRVRIRVPERALAYWSMSGGQWAPATGRRQVLVGSSSRDIRLTGTVVVR